MGINKGIIYLLIVLILLSGCAPYRFEPDYKVKENLIKQYTSELFKIDKEIYEKYKLEPPKTRYKDSYPPTLFVDQQYFKKNKKLSKFISYNSLAIIGHSNPRFSIPIGMDLRNNNPDPLFTTDKSIVIGKVVAIKKVLKVYIDDELGPDTYRTKVEAKVELDNGKEVEVMYGFLVDLIETDEKLKEYKINSAEFNENSPWAVQIGKEWHLQSTRSKS